MQKLVSYFLALCIVLSYGVTAFSASEPVTLNSGEIIEFGSYEQDNITSNGPEPIEWQVLDVEGDEAFLVSIYALDVMKFNETVKSLEKTCDLLWAESDIRAWLNQDFLETAFSEDERNCLVPVENEGNITDLVFLLSKEELLRYFPWEYDQMCQPTEFATVKEGSRDKLKQLGVELIEPSCHYFLRSYNPTDKGVDVVSFKSISPVEYINQEYVRPAVRADTSKLSAIREKLHIEKRDFIEAGSDEVSYDFLVGYWSSRNGMHTFEMKKDHGYITTVPVVPRSGDTYDLIDGVIYKYFANNPGNKTANLKFTKISDTEIEVYAYQTNTSYTLIKRR